jgi:hypothetical protein
VLLVVMVLVVVVRDRPCLPGLTQCPFKGRAATLKRHVAINRGSRGLSYCGRYGTEAVYLMGALGGRQYA